MKTAKQNEKGAIRIGNVKLDFCLLSPDELNDLIDVDQYTDENLDGYQRDDKHYMQISKAFDEEYVEKECGFAYLTQPIFVVKRKDGKMYVVDGQGRRGAAIASGISLSAVIVSGIDKREEIKAFILNNTSRNMSTDLYMDNLSRTCEPVGEFYTLLDMYMPAWRDLGISRLSYMDILTVAQGGSARVSRKTVADTLGSATDIHYDYIKQCVKIIRESFPDPESYVEMKKKERPINPWTNKDCLLAAFAVIVQFHRRFGNSEHTDSLLVNLFKRNINPKSNVSLWEHAWNNSKPSSGSSRKYHWVAGWVISAWNKQQKMAKGQVPYLTSRHPDWCGLKGSSVEDLPYRFGYMMPQTTKRKVAKV